MNDEPISKTPQSKAEKGVEEDAPTIEALDETQTSATTPAEHKTEISPDDIAVLAGLVNETFAQDLVKLVNGEGIAEGQQVASVSSGPLEDKSKRGQIHGEVRRIFKSRLETSTDGTGAIMATKVPLRKGKKRNRGARGQPDDKPTGEYLHFTLYKDNRDTMDAVNQIARMLRIKPQSIGYAGTKDRRASTAQRCSVRYMRQRALAGTNSKLWGIATGDYAYRDDPIHLGQLLGNEFVITLKNCKVVGESADTPTAVRLERMRRRVQEALDHMARHGWINYFGHQRFGTYDIGTHEIGKLILGNKWEEAVKALLSFDPEIAAKAAAGEVPAEAMKRDEYARHHACMLFLTGKDVSKAARIIPGRYTAESCILRHLTRMGTGALKDYAGALTHITRGLRSMYLHAYQSHVWNHVASRRWELHGDKVIAGDLVISDAADAAPPATEKDQDGDEIVNPGDEADDDAVRARPLTEEEATGGRFTIHDVVLPSPGYDVRYPDNDIGRFYEEFMGREENGALDPHNMRRLRREFSLPGRYRKLMHRFLAEPSLEMRLYADDTEQMHPTDLDVIKLAGDGIGSGGKRRRGETDGEGANKRAKTEEGCGEGSAHNVSGDAIADVLADQDPAAEPDKIAAVVKFQLGSSAYATVALRELMGDPPEETASEKPTKETKE
ncbi:tRNA pseudouridine(13) synthase [Purpureocillium takamizusanense]|nr:tRNA pseudouridine(13) synthase [Purpureocillium takamizusanense]UNI14240.1 tRNA pseudouridine(13) synthase [Purpureocillium takamizusanense]